MPIKDWAELTATIAVIGCLIYLITRGIPQILEKWALASKAERDAYIEASKSERAAFIEASKAEREAFFSMGVKERQDFKDTLSEYRAHSRALAEEGHAAVMRLADAIDGTDISVTRKKQEPPA